MQSDKQPTTESERLYPKLSPADKDRFLHDFAQAIKVGAVKRGAARVTVQGIDERRKRT